jgi:hypothetical protein
MPFKQGLTYRRKITKGKQITNKGYSFKSSSPNLLTVNNNNASPTAALAPAAKSNCDNIENCGRNPNSRKRKDNSSCSGIETVSTRRVNINKSTTPCNISPATDCLLRPTKRQRIAFGNSLAKLRKEAVEEED